VVSYLRGLDLHVPSGILLHGAGRGRGPLRCLRRVLAVVRAACWKRDRLHAAGLNVLGRPLDPFRTLASVRHNDVVIVPGMGVLKATLPLRPSAFPYSLFRGGHGTPDRHLGGAGQCRLQT
jgi:hypothetical protein